MDDILQKLLGSELLSEQTKSEISAEWKKSVEAFKGDVRNEVSLNVRAELAEQWIAEREELIEQVDKFVSSSLLKEVQELKNDIASFRDLEAEFAMKLVEEKYKLNEAAQQKIDAAESAAAAEVLMIKEDTAKEMQVLAESTKQEIDNLVDKLDSFLEIRLGSEIEEFKEDLALVKQNEFGREIFEAFASTFNKSCVDKKSIQNRLAIAESQLAKTKQELKNAEVNREQAIRESKLNSLLVNLSGKKREQMEMVLKNVETARLEESYKFFIGRILKDDARDVSLSENAPVQKTTIITGNNDEVEQIARPLVSEELKNLQRLAGIHK